ncbi:MAG TPA: glucose-6-phosphate dehydrogenase [Candidatus Acidoferrum sp.]|nr:glucose-6-phosphate dehydrogenase [Candidatus Acidoferrum sp.]
MIDGKPQLEPAIFVVFGITGDLAAKKLLPSLYHLMKDNLVHEQTMIMGVTRQQLTAESLLEHVEVCVNEADKICDPVALAKLQQKLVVHTMDPESPEAYANLKEHLQHIEDANGVCMNRLFYLAVPPQTVGPVVELLGKGGLSEGCKHGQADSRLLIEKPFGWDTASAQTLVDNMSTHFSEEQIYRIDHYVARETVQNILTFRRENPLFGAVWDSEHIEAIHIIAKEKIGIEGRAAFYEPTGALRDFVQSHLLQLLALVTMELPGSMASGDIHDKKLALLAQVSVVQKGGKPVAQRAQYDTYKQEVGNAQSTTETYVKLGLAIANDRWHDTAITLETGKAMDEKLTEITMLFRYGKQPGKLVFRLYPLEGIELDLMVKKPGFDDKLQTAQMSYKYRDAGSAPEHPDAYERVLVDAARGDHTLFTTSDETLACWQIVQPVLDYWQSADVEAPLVYPSGSGQVLDDRAMLGRHFVLQ